MLLKMVGTPEKVSLEFGKIISRVRSTLSEGTKISRDDGHPGLPGKVRLGVPEDTFSSVVNPTGISKRFM